MNDKTVFLTVLVAALGYFVDVYDILIFSIVRIPSLKAINIPQEDLVDAGLMILNIQMAGMLVGGLLWGMMGDRRGRKSVLFGSILLYSVATLLNPFVTTIGQYGLCRFFAGVGLAGELGAAVTLVAEVMKNNKRGYGVALIAVAGMFGGAFAGLMGKLVDWQHAYYIGGLMGFLVLALRTFVPESDLFAKQKRRQESFGEFLNILIKGHRLKTYVTFILIGLPIWFSIAFVFTLMPEIAEKLGVNGAISIGLVFMIMQLSAAFGDMTTALMRQWFKNTRAVILKSLIIGWLAIVVLLHAEGASALYVYFLLSILGWCLGYWVALITIGAELFGTNVRAMVTTSGTNFVRASVIPMTAVFNYLKAHMSLLDSILVLATIIFLMAGLLLMRMPETFGRSMDFTEK